MDHIILGIIFLVWGAADVLRLQLPGVLARRLEAARGRAPRASVRPPLLAEASGCA